MSNYNIIKSIEPPPIIELLGPNYGVKKNESSKINQKKIENLFKEKKIVLEISSAIENKDYNLLYRILDSLPNFEDISELYLSFIKELRKHKYTLSQLMAISTLLYRLSNIKLASVKLPKTFPLDSIPSIANILRNKELRNAKKIDLKIKEIVKNMITHYKLEIKNNRKYNYASNDGRLALKLKNILFSFIIDYTQPESSKPLEVKSVFPPDATIEIYN